METRFKKGHGMKDITGQKFGKLTAISIFDSDKYGYLWLCKCDCGSEKIARLSGLMKGTTKSCGCLYKTSNIGKTLKHGLSSHRLHHVWDLMKARCHRKSCFAYKDYGARGISVCDEWRNDFLSFAKWCFENGFKEDLELDRINNDGNYEPSNCKFSTRTEQMRNTRHNTIIEYNGEKHCISEWSVITGIRQGNISRRLIDGWSIERALTEKSFIGKNQSFGKGEKDNEQKRT